MKLRNLLAVVAVLSLITMAISMAAVLGILGFSINPSSLPWFAGSWTAFCLTVLIFAVTEKIFSVGMAACVGLALGCVLLIA